MVKTVSARTWWIMGLIVAGMATVTWTVVKVSFYTPNWIE